jgi:hypothetical protein
MGLTKFEKYLEDRLIKDLGEETGKSYYANYQQAKNYLSQEIFNNIKAVEPNLTDHSEKHIKNVLNNVWHLLDMENDSEVKLTCYDLYILCMSVLFHDVGNINGREDHNKKVTNVYNEVRKNNSKNFSERALILKTTKAHCGKTVTGSRDTLKEIETVSSLSGEPIQLLEIASILRFADELAEGPQRTSDYLINSDNVPKEFKVAFEKSKIYHKYAQITDIFIDRGNERIVLKYHIDINSETQESLKELLSYTYERIIKLDEERKYTRFYSKYLSPFKKTEVTLNFTNNGESLDVSVGTISLFDKCTIPGDKQVCATDLTSQFAELNIDSIINQLDFKK